MSANSKKVPEKMFASVRNGSKWCTLPCHNWWSWLNLTGRGAYALGTLGADALLSAVNVSELVIVADRLRTAHVLSDEVG